MDLTQLIKKPPSWNVGIFQVMKQPQYQCAFHITPLIFAIGYLRVVLELYSYCYQFDMVIQPSPPVDGDLGKINMLVIISGHGRYHFRSWQIHPAVWLGSNSFEGEALQLAMTWSNPIPHSGSFRRVPWAICQLQVPQRLGNSLLSTFEGSR